MLIGGQAQAALNFWHFNAWAELAVMVQIISVKDMLAEFGVSPPAAAAGLGVFLTDRAGPSRRHRAVSGCFICHQRPALDGRCALARHSPAVEGRRGRRRPFHRAARRIAADTALNKGDRTKDLELIEIQSALNTQIPFVFRRVIAGSP